MWFKQLILNWIVGRKPLPPLNKEQALGLLSQLYENPAFMKFLDAREDYLIRQGMERFLRGEITKADALAGQLVEIRNMRMRVRAAHGALGKINKQQKDLQDKKKV